MKLRIPLACLIAAATLAIGVNYASTSFAQAAPAAAAAPAPTKIAIVNPARVFNEMQETKDLKLKLESERKMLEQTEQDKRKRLQELQDSRNLLKPDSPQYQDKTRELTQAFVEFKAWGEITQQEIQRNQKMQMKTLFDRIQAATAQLAIQRGYDLVLSDQRPDFPENMEQITVEQLRALINQRNILFASPTVDLSADVTAFLDAQYKNTPVGGAPAATPGK